MKVVPDENMLSSEQNGYLHCLLLDFLLGFWNLRLTNQLCNQWRYLSRNHFMFWYQGLLPWFYISLSCIEKHEFIRTTYFCVLVQKKKKTKTILSSSETQVVGIPQIYWTFKSKMVCICYHTFPVSQPLQVDQHLDHLLEQFLPHLFQPKQKIMSGNSDKQHQRSINTPK